MIFLIVWSDYYMLESVADLQEHAVFILIWDYKALCRVDTASLLSLPFIEIVYKLLSVSEVMHML